MTYWNIDAVRIARLRGLPLAEAVRQWDRGLDVGLRDAAEQQRRRVLELFPLESWGTLPIEGYALGTGVDDSFSKLLEYRTPDLGGIGGGTALKFLLYRRQDGSWYHRPEYTDVTEAWQAIRSGFVRAFELARAGEWQAIDQIVSIQPATALRGKTMYVYFPDDLLPVYAPSYQAHFWAALAGHGSPPEGVAGSRALLELARSTDLFDGWQSVDIARFLGGWSDPRVAKRIVKIAPGNAAEFWQDCHDRGYICVGWDEVGDLKQFESREQFRASFGAAFPNYSPSKASAKANEVWTLMELQPGDIVLANQGTARIVGIGKVVEPAYAWDPVSSRPWGFHTVAVDWEDKPPWDIDPVKKWAMTTVSDVSAEEYKRILGGVSQDGRKDDPELTPIPPDARLAEMATTIDRKGQVILYGPPGTGKTYHARRFSVWWLADLAGLPEATTLLGDHAAFRRVEEQLSVEPRDGAARLTRVTFHPSYGYEDFVEGYKPQPTGTGQLDLRLVDGIFKRVCTAAAADPKRPYLLVIDEINRGNIPKIFGELITLLEKDKRGLTVVLPQSRAAFSVPPNLRLLGTMNTADRSIKLLDAALRRRFAFIELMPDTEPLAGGRVGDLDLAVFLAGLNTRIAATEGREKQIGHSFLLDEHGQPVATIEEFAQRFRYEILPLLQEYAYEDYAELESYIGPKLVNAREQTLNGDILADPQALVDALRAVFQPRPTLEDLAAGPPEGIAPVIEVLSPAAPTPS